MKHRRLLALLLAAVLAVTALGASAFAAEEAKDTSKPAAEESAEKPARGEKPGGKEKVAEPEGAVGKDAAKTAALADAGLTADQTGKVRSRVAKTEDGTVIYKVSFRYEGQKYSYKVDAMTGKILDKTVKEITEKSAGETKDAKSA